MRRVDEMGCCIAIALVIGVVRTAWFKLFPSRAPVHMAFAPPARRPAPGAEVWTDHDRRPNAASAPAAAPARSPRRSSVIGRAPACGTALVIAGVAWLAVSEVAAHVLHIVEHSDVLHAPGPIAVAIGLALRGGLAPTRL